jgi:sensor histidine kinase YesM
MPPDRLASLRGQGIGVSNVSERLKVLFGEEGVLRIDSEEGRGPRVEIQVPENVPQNPPGALTAV